MPPQRTQQTNRPPKAAKSERTHEENQERAYIAASRRSDRSLEARVESARRASEIHKRRTGRALRVTEQDVLNEEMYEEEDDEPQFFRNPYQNMGFMMNPTGIDRRFAAYYHHQMRMQAAVRQDMNNRYHAQGPEGMVQVQQNYHNPMMMQSVPNVNPYQYATPIQQTPRHMVYPQQGHRQAPYGIPQNRGMPMQVQQQGVPVQQQMRPVGMASVGMTQAASPTHSTGYPQQPQLHQQGMQSRHTSASPIGHNMTLPNSGLPISEAGSVPYSNGSNSGGLVALNSPVNNNISSPVNNMGSTVDSSPIQGQYSTFPLTPEIPAETMRLLQGTMQQTHITGYHNNQYAAQQLMAKASLGTQMSMVTGMGQGAPIVVNKVQDRLPSPPADTVQLDESIKVEPPSSDNITPILTNLSPSSDFTIDTPSTTISTGSSPETFSSSNAVNDNLGFHFNSAGDFVPNAENFDMNCSLIPEQNQQLAHALFSGEALDSQWDRYLGQTDCSWSIPEQKVPIP